MVARGFSLWKEATAPFTILYYSPPGGRTKDLYQGLISLATNARPSGGEDEMALSDSRIEVASYKRMPSRQTDNQAHLKSSFHQALSHAGAAI
jgi:hypothetical protein